MDFSAISPTLTIAVALAICIVPIFVIKKTKNHIRGPRQKTNGNDSPCSSGVIGPSNGDNNTNVAGVNIHNSTVNINRSPSKQSNNQNEEHSVDFATNILFVDDTPKTKDELPLITLLESYGFTSVNLANDPKIVSNEVVNAKIVFVDITGVGKSSGCNDGTELAVKIKRRYPDKIVAIYSSTETHNTLVPGLTDLDGNFGKNDDSQIYIDFIEQHARRN